MIPFENMDLLINIVLIVSCLSSICCNENKIHLCPERVKNISFLKTFKDTCYMFVNSEKYWDEARSYCWREGGEMLVVRDAETMDFIKRTLNSRELNWKKNGVWNGASDLRKKGWEWTTGEPLSKGYTYWAEGEPSKTFGFLSFENCACMRRSEDWRWHDYHCHMDLTVYNFICQFPLVDENHTGPLVHNTGAPLKTENKSSGPMIGLLIAAGVLLLLMSCIVFILRTKYARQKELYKRVKERGAQPQRGFAAIIQRQEGLGSPSRARGDSLPLVSRNGAPPTRPVSNIYLEPSEINGVNSPPPAYETVRKPDNVSMGRNNDMSDIQSTSPSQRQRNAPVSVLSTENETVHMSYVGGAASADCLAASSDETGATAGIVSKSGPAVACRNVSNDEYVEMSSTLSTDSGISSLANHGRGSEENLKGGGATGCVRSTNIYSSPMTLSDYVKNGRSVRQGEPKCGKAVGDSDNSEIHIYTNSLEELDLIQKRPLPAVPNDKA